MLLSFAFLFAGELANWVKSDGAIEIDSYA